MATQTIPAEVSHRYTFKGSALFSRATSRRTPTTGAVSDIGLGRVSRGPGWRGQGGHHLLPLVQPVVHSPQHARPQPARPQAARGLAVCGWLCVAAVCGWPIDWREHALA